MRHPNDARKPGRSALVLTVCALAGCGPAVSSSGSRHVRSPELRQTSAPYAPAGQQIAVRLEQSIDTLENVREQAFTASLLTPIVDEHGAVFAPAGAEVYGRIVSLGSRRSPHVRLAFDAVQTAHGTLPLAAAVRGAQYHRYPGPVTYLPPPADYYGIRPGWGGGPPPVGWTEFEPREVRLPVNAELQLVLTRPIVATARDRR